MKLSLAKSTNCPHPSFTSQRLHMHQDQKSTTQILSCDVHLSSKKLSFASNPEKKQLQHPSGLSLQLHTKPRYACRLTAVFTPAVARLAGQFVSSREWAACAIALVGGLLISFDSLSSSESSARDAALGQAQLLRSTIWALHHSIYAYHLLIPHAFCTGPLTPSFH